MNNKKDKTTYPTYDLYTAFYRFIYSKISITKIDWCAQVLSASLWLQKYFCKSSLCWLYLLDQDHRELESIGANFTFMSFLKSVIKSLSLSSQGLIIYS